MFVNFGGYRSGVDTGDNIPYSLMLDSGSSQYLSRTFGAPTTQNTFTAFGWAKRGKQGVAQNLLGVSTNNSIGFNAGDALVVTLAGSATITTTALFRDPTAWYFWLYRQTTGAAYLEVNGVQVGTSATVSAVFNTAVAHQFGAANTAGYLDDYNALVGWVDGQTLPSSNFGRTSADTGQWVNKTYTGTYGNNGFKLEFNDPTFATYGMGKDTSGNNNHWTPQGGISSANQYTDTPTCNYPVCNALLPSIPTLKKGNTSLYNASGVWLGAQCTMPISSGKWEAQANWTNGAGNYFALGVTAEATNPTYPGVDATSWGIWGVNTQINSVTNGTSTNNTPGTYTTADTIRCAVDFDAGKIWLGLNTTWLGGGSPSTGTSPTYTFTANTKLSFMVAALSNEVVLNCGQRPLGQAISTGFKALNTANLPTPAILKPALHFQALLDTGANIKTNLAVLFTYYLDWIKDRANSNNHQLIDTVRGSAAVLQSNMTAVETTYTQPTGSSVGWAWKMGGAAVTNNAGSISSQVSANQLAGQSVVTYTGTGANATVGHGLLKAPELVTVKNRNGSNWWRVRHESLAAGKYLYLNATNAEATDSVWLSNSTSVFNLAGSNSAEFNGSTLTYVAYCFHSVEGYSKIGSATGNASADGMYIATGGKSRFFLIKCSSTTGPWYIFDSARSTINVVGEQLYPNTAAAESVVATMDFDAGGVKFRLAGDPNAAQTYVYYTAFEASQKFATAR